MVYSARRFVVCLTLCHFVFFSPFSIAITSLGEERANLSAFRMFDRFVLVWICRFPLPLDVWEGLRFVIVALPGLFPYIFCIAVKVFCVTTSRVDGTLKSWSAIHLGIGNSKQNLHIWICLFQLCKVWLGSWGYSYIINLCIALSSLNCYISKDIRSNTVFCGYLLGASCCFCGEIRNNSYFLDEKVLSRSLILMSTLIKLCNF